VYAYLVINTFFHQRLGHGCVHADEAFVEVKLIWASDAINGFIAVFIFQSDPCAKKDGVLVAGQISYYF